MTAELKLKKTPNPQARPPLYPWQPQAASADHTAPEPVPPCTRLQWTEHHLTPLGDEGRRTQQKNKKKMPRNEFKLGVT